MPSRPDPKATPPGREAAPSSSSRLGRRVLALLIDWAIASAISAGFLDLHPMATLAVFAGMTFLLVTTLGATIGHRLLGLRIHRMADGATPPRPLQALVRTVALCLVVPVGIWDTDGRGMHDVWAGTRIASWGAPPSSS